MTELSGYVLETLRKGAEFILYRGRQRGKSSPVLVLAIMGDRVQLQQVILNLIMNGIEAMSAVMRQPRLLRVRSQNDGPGYLLIAVEDSGPGLAPETMGRLFEPFFTTKPGGMGLGLSICRSIVDAHGGRLSASSQSPRGAVFQFTVPLAAKWGS